MFEIEENIDKTKLFFINLSQIEGRLDPMTYHPERLQTIEKLKNSKVKSYPLKNLVHFSKETVKEIDNSNPIYVGLENIESNTGEYFPTNQKESISSAILFNKGDILFPKLRPYLNKVFYATFNGICSTEFHVFKSSKLNNQYLAHFLRSKFIVNQTKYLMSGNTLPRLQTEDVLNLLIPLPDSLTQMKVVEVMENAKNKQHKKKHQAQTLLNSIDQYVLKELGINLPEKDNSLRARMFTTTFNQVTGKRFDPYYYLDTFINHIEKSDYPFEKLAKHVKYFWSGFAAGKKEQSCSETDIIQIRPTNISEKRTFVFERNIYLSRSLLAKKKEEILIKDEVLFNNTNSQELVGKSILFDLDGEYFCSNHITRIETKESIEPSYLTLILNIYQRNQVFYNLCTNWNNQSGINSSVLKNIKIPVPPIEKQKQIAKEANRRRYEAQQLEKEAKETLEQARQEIEKIILE